MFNGGNGMKISTEISSLSALVGDEKAVECVANAGFDAWDFSMFGAADNDHDGGRLIFNSHPLSGREYSAYAKKLKQIGLDSGIVCNQSHAPFPTWGVKSLPILMRSIECTALAGGSICVIHPNNNLSAAENAEMYNALLPFAKDCGVKIATENMWNWNKEKDEASAAACSSPESFNAHLDAVNDSFFVACLDIGHAEMKGLGTCAVDMIHALGSRLEALHIHDNDRWHDSHQIPFSMDIDFVPIVAALKEIGYGGYFTLEAGEYAKDFDADTAYKAARELALSARKLADMFDKSVTK